MVPVNAPGDGVSEDHKVNRAELVSVITEQLARLTDEAGRALKGLDFAGARGQVVLTGGGAQLAGVAEFMQGALGRPVRVGKPPDIRGLPDAMRNPGFATLAGLCIYAANDPIDIRSIDQRYQKTTRATGVGLINRIWAAAREHF